MRVIGYCRVSTLKQEYGIDAQRAAITAEAGRRGWEVVWIEDAGRSGKDIDRPGIQRALQMLKMQEAEALVVAKLDRLSRSLSDFARVLEVSSQQHWGVIALDLGVDTTTPTGELVANLMASVSRWERRMIGLRTKEGLAEAKRQGVHVGRRSQVPPEVRQRIQQQRAQGMSLAAIAAGLETDETPTATGRGHWYASTVKAVLDSLPEVAGEDIPVQHAR